MTTITLTDIQPKPHTVCGHRYEPKNTDGVYNADVIKNQSIRIYGTYTNRLGGPVQFDRTFQIGETVEVGSYNLTYTGTIEAISDKRVTYREYKNDTHTKCMDLYDFIWRNWDLDLDKIAADNFETMQYI